MPRLLLQLLQMLALKLMVLPGCLCVLPAGAHRMLYSQAACHVVLSSALLLVLVVVVVLLSTVALALCAMRVLRAVVHEQHYHRLRQLKDKHHQQLLHSHCDGTEIKIRRTTDLHRN